jgi:hypothetical protein
LRTTNARSRSRRVSPARVPNTAPVPKPTTSSMGALTSASQAIAGPSWSPPSAAAVIGRPR